MFAPSSDFHDKIKDPSTYRQNLVLAFANGYFSGNDGDIEQSGVEFDDYYCTAEDLSYGECPSGTLKASLINRDQVLRSFQWGECSAYIGYLSDTEYYDFSDEDINAQYTYNSHTYTASKNGFLIDDTTVSGAECYSFLIVSETTLYAFGNGYSYAVDLSDASYTDYAVNRFMVTKMMTPKMVQWNPSADGVFEVVLKTGGVSTTWVYAPMGVYYVEKPKNLSGDVVDIEEAFDRMRLFDVDATDFIEEFNASHTSPTVAEWLSALCTYVGVTTTAVGTATVAEYTPNTATTLRTILGQIAEALKGVFRFNRYGVLELVPITATAVEEVEIRRIEHSTLAVAEYLTRPVTKVVNKNLGGLTYVEGSGGNAYYILGNPFVQDNTELSVSDYAFYTFAPMSCVVLEADTLVDMGDAVNIWLTDDEYRAYVDEYNRMFVDEQDRILTEETRPVMMPLMHRTMVWNGVCTATYESTGNKTRLVPDDFFNTDYNANLANDAENVINKIVAHGIEADWIKTGKLESPNGEYSLDMETGTVNMANANITGGTISMETDSSTANKFVLNLENDAWSYQIWINPAGVNSSNKAKLVGATNESHYGGSAGWTDTWDNDGSGQYVQVGSIGFLMYTRPSASASWVKRIQLDLSGLTFYDANGNVTKSYPAT